VPAVTAEAAAAPLGVLRARAAEVGTTLQEIGAGDIEVAADEAGTRFALDTATWGHVRLESPLLGPHQGWNGALAVRALDLLPPALRPGKEALRRGVARVDWPGRLQREEAFGRTWLFDVAHNVAGVEALVGALPLLALPRPLVALVGVLGDKDWRGMLGPLHARADAMILTLPPTAPAERRWDPDEVLRAVALPAAVAVRDFTEALELAWWRTGKDGAGTILVTGSFHTVGDALIALERSPFGADVTLPRPSFAA
jgi:dihydrofolate synthase/folylpolyglutamate synthase